MTASLNGIGGGAVLTLPPVDKGTKVAPLNVYPEDIVTFGPGDELPLCFADLYSGSLVIDRRSIAI